MAAAEQRNRCDDTCGSSVRTSYGEPVARPTRGEELRDRDYVGRLDRVELTEAPDGQPRPVHEQIGPGSQVDQPNDERPERYHDDQCGHPSGRASAGQYAYADRCGNAGEERRGPPVVGSSSGCAI